VTLPSPEPSRWTVPDIWGNVPKRNRNFTGRRDLLEELRRRASSATPTAVLPQAVHGIGGVGKTQLAIEYAYTYADQYQLVWWIPSDQIPLVRSTIAALAPRLGLTDLPRGRVEDAVAAVLDALRRGKPYDRWLLVFDNADEPEDISEFFPVSRGHIIVTSRNRGWAESYDALEVDVFTRDESKQYLARRVPGILSEDANQLAQELGDLPLALEQAAALLAQTVMTAPMYLELLAKESDRVLAENPPPPDYPVPVAAAWSLSVTRLREQTPYALELLQRCAFFGPTPISLDLLDRGRYVLDSPMKEILRDGILMSRAIRALGRYSLARIDQFRRTIEVHRIIQRLIRNELDPEVRFSMRHEVHLLLAASDPGDPDNIDNWPKYLELLGHVRPAEVVTCRSDVVRQLYQNIVRYLYITGDYTSALSAADDALTEWAAKSEAGEDDKFVLIMSRLKAQVLRALGRYAESYELTARTIERMRRVFGDDHEETLILMNGHCVDLRAQGDFKSSLEHTKVTLDHHIEVFGPDHPRTLMAMNNLAEDYEINSQYAEARDLSEKLYEERRVVYHSDNHPLVVLTLNALARIMREEGHYREACETAGRAYEGYKDLVRQHVIADNHPWVLQQIVDYSAALRAAGADPESLEMAQEAYGRYLKTFGPDHAATLAAIVNLSNAHRIHGNLQQAKKLIETAIDRYNSQFGDNNPYALCSQLNLAIITRRLGDAKLAGKQLEELQQVMNRSFGPDQHPSLLCAANLANALADLDDGEAAAKQGEATLPRLAKLLGDDHPNTLTCASNLAIDLKASGQIQRAEEIASDAVERYRRVLGPEHPEVRAAEKRERQDLGIEVPFLN
jgi:tetratricopeptide (TPR) repeat protein